jgi:(2R)-sulfolactate sulfo-lyase subunit beta
MVTLCAASGYAVHFFPTGQGNVIGNPILPVIKLTANPRTQRTMSEHIDVDVTGPAAEAHEHGRGRGGAARLHAAHRGGRADAAELLGHREFSLTRLYESA